ATAVREPGAAAAKRAFVFASCGLQGGCAVIGERHVLEYLMPRSTDDAQLRRSWTGEWSESALQPRLFFYDRSRTPYPPLDGEEILAHEPELAAYRAAALEWLRVMTETRLSLQGPAGGPSPDEAALRRAGAESPAGSR